MSSISLSRVDLALPIYGVGTQHFRAAIAKTLLGLGRGNDIDHHVRTVQPLQSISMEVKSGDRLALIGGNGAGKTTLLRVMAGIYEPTAGKIRRNGRIQTVLDVNSGLEEEATGFDNIYIRSRYMGASGREARSIVDDVVDFADLGQYIHLPIRTYSAGMRLRLAFAITTAFETDILLIDEILGVGDAAFQEKAAQRMQTMINRAGLVVLATHSLTLSDAIASRAAFLEHGRLIVDGAYSDVVNIYMDSVNRAHLRVAAE